MSISAADVKKLRDQTGAGMMDCKNALKETDGNIEKAIEYLRKKGIASAQKRAGREAKEGMIMSYIHPGSRLGVMIEINCETDFVAKTDDFNSLAKDIAMQIAASNPIAITREEVPTEAINKELDIFRAQAKNEGKPDAIIEKIVQGKIEKYYQEVVLMEQPFVKDTNKSVKDHLFEVSGRLGEAMNVKRFVRFQLGEE
jgi:elongation factor Ts